MDIMGSWYSFRGLLAPELLPYTTHDMPGAEECVVRTLSLTVCAFWPGIGCVLSTYLKNGKGFRVLIVLKQGIKNHIS